MTARSRASGSGRPGGAAARVALAALLACGGEQDLAALIVGELDGQPGDAHDAGATSSAPPASFAILGVPAAAGRTEFEVAEWPLATPLRAFFAGSSRGAQRVTVRGDDRPPLWQLRRAVAAGEHGPSRDTVLVQDGRGDRYFVVFSAE